MDITLLCLFAIVLSIAEAVPITVPKDSTVCTSANWDDFVVFCLTTYVTHAATVVRFPGETTKELSIRRADALLAPYFGLMYALRKIQWYLILERDHLRRAYRGEALVQIVRSNNWKPVHGSLVKGLVHKKPLPSEGSSSTSNLSVKKYCCFEMKQTEQSGPKPVIIDHPKKRKLIQGFGYLPPEYTVLRCQGVPSLRLSRTTEGHKCGLYYDHRIMESILALCQILFSIVTLCKSRGFHFDHFGYAAFSLTVPPFAAMSLANLIANCLSVDYPAFHLVSSPELEEAKKRGAMFTAAVVGRLVPDPESERFSKTIQFSEVNGKMHAFVTSETGGADSEDLGEVLDVADRSRIHRPSCIITRLTISSNTRVLEESPIQPPKGRFLKAWRFLRTRDNIGGILCIPFGVMLFSAPSIITKLLTNFQSHAPVVQKLAFLTWVYYQHFALLFLLFWNVVFDVEHSLRAPSKYSKPLQKGLGYSLRAVGLAGYMAVILQIRQYGLCVQV